MTRRGQRVLLVGWDGATWTAIDPLIEAGRLPNLARLLRDGFRAVLQSTVPPVTPAAWTSIATGLGPGRTGVLGFRHLDLRRASGYDPRLAGSEDLRGRTLFEHAAASGVGVALAAYPMTWPPFPLPGGVMLSGWPRPETPTAPVWPPEEGARLEPWGSGPSRPSSTTHCRDGTFGPELAAEELDGRTVEVALGWLRQRDDSFVAVGLQGTDHLAHRYWGEEALWRGYERADTWLGALLDAAGPEADVVVVSDHGFGAGPRHRVHLGRALARAGLLHCRKPGAAVTGRVSRRVRRALPGQTWKMVRDRLPPAARRWGFERALTADGLDPSRTRVSRVSLYEGWEGLVVQVRGRQRQGSVRPEEWAAVRDRAAEVVRGIEHDGAPVAARVLPREDVWEGPALPGMPDLLIELAEGFTAGELLDEGPIVEPLDREPGSGSHRREGIVAGSGPGLRGAGRVAPFAPWDVVPTALALIGCPCPEGIDGRPREDVLQETPPPPVTRRGATGQEGSFPATGSDGLEQSLRDLGYL